MLERPPEADNSLSGMFTISFVGVGCTSFMTWHQRQIQAYRISITAFLRGSQEVSAGVQSHLSAISRLNDYDSLQAVYLLTVGPSWVHHSLRLSGFIHEFLSLLKIVSPIEQSKNSFLPPSGTSKPGKQLLSLKEAKEQSFPLFISVIVGWKSLLCSLRKERVIQRKSPSIYSSMIHEYPSNSSVRSLLLDQDRSLNCY